jgi:hypothetical protein
MRRLQSLLAGLACTLAASTVYADKVCDASYDQAQTFRDAKKLLEARDQLRVCAGATCSASVVKECTTWLSEIEPRIPSVQLVATDASGAVLPNVTATVDASPVPRNVDGTSWDVDPGQHTFTVTGPDGAKVAKTAVVLEAQKDQRIIVPLTAPEPRRAGKSLWRPVGYAVGAVGVAGVIVGAVVGGVALSEKGSDCPTNLGCKPAGTASSIHTLGTVSTIGFVAGGILVAGGVAMVLFAPSKSEPATASVAPLVGPGAGGLLLTGRW